MDTVPALERGTPAAPFTSARVRRRLTVEHAARLAGLTADEVTWLEDGRLYRFPSSESALLAVLLYSTALGIDRREARRLAGLPLVTLPRGNNRVRRYVGAAVAGVFLAAAAGAFALPEIVDGSGKPVPASEAGLIPSWHVSVDVLNGSA